MGLSFKGRTKRWQCFDTGSSPVRSTKGLWCYR